VIDLGVSRVLRYLVKLSFLWIVYLTAHVADVIVHRQVRVWCLGVAALTADTHLSVCGEGSYMVFRPSLPVLRLPSTV